MQDFSIFFPFITEEIYQELYHNNISIHLTNIKQFKFLFDEEVKYGNIICEIISSVRGKKSENNLSLKTPVKLLNIDCDEKIKTALESSIKDFKATLFIENLNINTIKEGYKINKIELNTEQTNI